MTPAGRVLLAWVDRAADGAGDILVAASDDGGRGFHPPVRVNDDEGAGRGQEYQNMQITPSGLVVLVWLDERLGAVLAWEDDGRTLAHARLMAREEGIPMGRHEHDFSKDP